MRDRRGLPYTLTLDAEQGRVLGSRPRFRTLAAPVYPADPTSTPVREVRELTDLDDSGWLQGPFADVRLNGAIRLRGVGGDRLKRGNDGFHFVPGDGRSAQVNAFYHANRVHAFYRSLGVEGLDAPIPVLMRFKERSGERFTNAFFDETAGDHGVIALGEGPNGEDLSLDASILYHEYTHYVIQTVNPDLAEARTLEAAALNEALADYGAATLTGDPASAPFLAPLVVDRPSLRDLTSRRHYPEDTAANEARDPLGRYAGFTHEHDLGEIVSGSLWDLRNRVGAEAADRLFVGALPLMDGSTSFPEVRIAFLEADQQLNRGAHAEALRQVFDARGITGRAARYLSSFDFFSLGDLSGGLPAMVFLGPVSEDPQTHARTVEPMDLCSTFVAGRPYPLSGLVTDEKATTVTLNVSDLKGNRIEALCRTQDVSHQEASEGFGIFSGRAFDFPVEFPKEYAGRTVSLSMTIQAGTNTSETASVWVHVVAEPGPAIPPVSEPIRPSARLLGDANRDGQLTVADVTLLLRSAVGLDPTDLSEALLQDVGPKHADGTVGDDSVSVPDAVRLLSRVVSGAGSEK